MKNFLCIIVVLVAVAFLAGCKKEEAAIVPVVVETEDTEPETVVVTVVSPFDENDGNRVNFLNAYRAFELATGYAVEDIASASNEEWKARVWEDFNTGNEPDVLFYFTGADADELVNSGKVVPVSDIRRVYPDFASNMKDSMMPVSTANGRQYAVPVNGYWESMFVNKKVLEVSGVDIPGADYTWEQFLIDCQKIRDSGFTPIALSLAEIPHYIFEYAIFNNGGMANHISLPQSSDDKVGQFWAAGLNDIKELYELGFFPENTLAAPDSETAALFLQDEAAFLIDGSWQVGWVQKNASDIENFMVTYVPSKGERKTTEIIGGLSMGYYITKKAWDDPAKREASVQFVMAMTTDKVVSSFAVETLAVTALKNGISMPDQTDSLVLSVLDMTRGCTGIVPAAQDMLNLIARRDLFTQVPNIVTGEITPEEVIDMCLSISKGL